MSNILVTGGAGYIGSHTAKLLGAAGHNLTTLDDLSKGFREAVLFGELVVGDVGDMALVDSLLSTRKIDSVIHFAAKTIVPESVENPLLYYGNNTSKTRNLIECCVRNGVRNFIFSSTAAVYGIPASGRCSEQSPLAPINPYGTSKMMSEMILRDTAAASELNYVILRYFNVAGSDPDGEIGQSTPNATLLIKVACEVAMGKRDKLLVYGTDYDTPDGTGVRDYIHVTDLALAHLNALEYLERGGHSQTLNCGYGRGMSVNEIIEIVEAAHGSTLNVERVGRRAGDPPSLIAEADAIRTLLGWHPQHASAEEIVRTSLAWEQNRTW